MTRLEPESTPSAEEHYLLRPLIGKNGSLFYGVFFCKLYIGLKKYGHDVWFKLSYKALNHTKEVKFDPDQAKEKKFLNLL